MKIGKILILAMVVSSLLAISISSVVAVDESEVITDPPNDVYSMGGLSGLEEIDEMVYITEHEDINVKNIDIREVRYDHQGTSVTLKIIVEGEIEDRGELLDPDDPGTAFIDNIDSVGYNFILQTTNDDMFNDYSVQYTNKTCQITYPDTYEPVDLSEDDCYVHNKNTLVVNFELESENETYEYLEVQATYTKINLADLDDLDPYSDDFDELFVWLVDAAPNLPVEVIAQTTNLGEVGKTVNFNGSALFGQPPYMYHWDFGDGSTSTERNPTHVYEKSGEYEYNLTVTDNSGATAIFSDTIEIVGDEKDEGNPILMFVGIIVVIAVIGVIAVVYIIRR